MDGLDGLLAGCMSIVLTVITIQFPTLAYVVISRSIAGVPFKQSPAKVFMGDVGSTYLGAVFAGLLLQAPRGQRLLAISLLQLLC